MFIYNKNCQQIPVLGRQGIAKNIVLDFGNKTEPPLSVRTYFWLNVAMHDALGMNEVDGRHQFPGYGTCLVFHELFLASNTIKQFTTG